MMMLCALPLFFWPERVVCMWCGLFPLNSRWSVMSVDGASPPFVDACHVPGALKQSDQHRIKRVGFWWRLHFEFLKEKWLFLHERSEISHINEQYVSENMLFIYHKWLRKDSSWLGQNDRIPGVLQSDTIVRYMRYDPSSPKREKNLSKDFLIDLQKKQNFIKNTSNIEIGNDSQAHFCKTGAKGQSVEEDNRSDGGCLATRIWYLRTLHVRCSDNQM